MATIEEHPLPPPNFAPRTITEADREQIISNAKDVIHHYLSGPGSYWDAGTQKPLQNRLEDLDDFKSAVAATKQFVDDPGKILDSVVELIKSSAEQAKRAVESNQRGDNIQLSPPDTNDQIFLDPKVTDEPNAMLKRSPGSLPIKSDGRVAPPAVDENARYLRRRLASQPLIS